MDEKRTRVQAMFATIAPGYDRLNGVLSLGLHHRWRARAVATLGLAPGDAAIDACCGTGDFLAPLRAAVGESGTVAGFDFALPMLARSVAKGLPPVALGDACALPVRSGVADGFTVGWGLRNVQDLPAAFAEAFRVLKPGGRFAALDTMVPRSALLRGTSRAAFSVGSRALGAVTGQRDAYAYLPESTRSFATPPELAAMMTEAGFEDARWSAIMLENVVLLTGRKPRPQTRID